MAEGQLSAAGFTGDRPERGTSRSQSGGECLGSLFSGQPASFIAQLSLGSAPDETSPFPTGPEVVTPSHC